MATRPKELFDLVKPRLLALGIQGLTVEYGPDAVVAHAAPPRIVWCKAGGDILPTDRAGGNPRPLVRRRVRLEVYLWGTDDEQAERLLEETIREVHALAAGVYRPVSEVWPKNKTPGETRLKATSLGENCILTFEVDLYVEARTFTVAPITATTFDTSTSSPTDQKLDAGEPG